MILLYFIKANIILALLCLLFQMLMYRDTFFGMRRLMLWGIYAMAFLLPLCNGQGLLAEGEVSSELAEAYAAYVLPTLNITATRVATLGIEQTEPGCGMWFVGLMMLWALIYIVPVVVLSLRLMWQVAYIIYLRCTCPKKNVDFNDSAFFLYPRPCSPFSFGPWIFMHTDDMNEQTLREVLVHEQTHVRQWHTADTLLAEVVCILCWWNPAAWVLRREVRMNLEFLADKAVADYLTSSVSGTSLTGYAVGGEALKAYQYHLLGFSSQMNVATISNNYNVLPLKRRITMMNSRKTNRTGMVKYILFVPVAALLLLFSNIDSLARGIDKDAKPQTVVDEKSDILEDPEVKPEFPGGEQALYMFISQNIRYPAVAQEHGVQGRVLVTFVIEKDGSITDVKADSDKKSQQQLEEVTVTAQKTDATPEQKEYAEKFAEGLTQLKEEAIRIAKLLPKWKPGQNEGKPVRVSFTLPLTFRLQ